MEKLKKAWSLLSGHKRAVGGTVYIVTVILSQRGHIFPETANVILTVSGCIFGIGVVHYVQKGVKKKLVFDLKALFDLIKNKSAR